MRILVTGASGFLGSRLVPELAAQGHSGIAVSRKRIDALPSGWSWEDRAAILSRSPGPAAPDALIHLEVKQHVPNPRPADIAEFTSVNVGGTQAWLDWSGSTGVTRFVYVSTIKAVSDSLEIQTENAGGQPSTPYGKSKRAAEDRVAAWTRQAQERSALILRPAVIYGPGNTANIASYIEAIDRNRFFLVGGSPNVKSIVSLGNAVSATAFLLERMSPGLQYYNLADAQSFSVCQLAETLSHLMGKPPRFHSLPTPVARAIALVGDFIVGVLHRNFPLTSNRLNALIETTHFSAQKLVATGFKHPQTTEEGLAEMVAWHRSRQV
jgi:nucleoside-diphosphate-sugar epimerase